MRVIRGQNHSLKIINKTLAEYATWWTTLAKGRRDAPRARNLTKKSTTSKFQTLLAMITVVGAVQPERISLFELPL